MSIDRLQVVFGGIDSNGHSRGYIATVESQRWINDGPVMRTCTRFFQSEKEAIQSLSEMIDSIRKLSDNQFVSKQQ